MTWSHPVNFSEKPAIFISIFHGDSSQAEEPKKTYTLPGFIFYR